MNKPVKALLPERRFPEFRDSEPWEVKRIGDIFQVTRGNVLSMNLVKDYQSKGFPHPVYSSQTKNNGLSGYYSEYLYQDAITWTTDGANAGDVNYRLGKFYCTNVCGVLLSSEGYANRFTAEILNSVTKKHVSYVGNPKLMNGVMAQIEIPIPLIPEQQKIADCLSSLDDLIRARAQKLEALKCHKKGLMQQLFPAQGQTTPQRRFPEFQDAGQWKEKRLGDICDMNAGVFVRAASIQDIAKEGLFPCYGGNGQRGFTETFTHDGPFSLIGRQGALCGNITLVSGKFHATEHAVVTTPKENTITEWLYYQLIRLNLNQFATGQAQPGLSVANLNEISVKIPKDGGEQQKIADCLISADDLIRAEAQKFDALKAHKKGLMQQLFPNPDGGVA